MFSAQNSQVSADFNYIEDVFSTWLYKGNGSTQSIDNGINLSGNGGLTWIKSRSAADHALYDTARGATFELVSNLTDAQTTQSTGLTAFNSNGFSLGALAKLNTNNVGYASWTFRKQPKFFDIVTYTGTGVARTVAHNLDAVPGCIIVKRTDVAADWQIYHRSLANTQYVVLNTTAAAATNADRWNSTTPTSTVFTIGTNAAVNASGGTYVAYLFANNAGGFGLTGTDNVISCGSYLSNATVPPEITLGYEPQFVLIKNITMSGDDWVVVDNMRGMNVSGTSRLYPNQNYAEGALSTTGATPTATGFKVIGTTPQTNDSTGRTHIYIAIRRGPMRTPTLGTSVFSVDTTTADSAITSTLKQSDMGWFKDRTTVANWFVADRLRNFTSAYYTPTLYTNLTNVEATPTTGDTVTAFGPTTTGVTNGVLYAGGAGVAGNYPLLYSFKRAPGFFDEVCYTGTSTAQNVTHNLTVPPELMIVKSRSNMTQWRVYSSLLGNTSDIVLNTSNPVNTGSTYWNSTTPTSTVFTLVGNNAQVNSAGLTYVAYLFATVAGVSKVGNYTGTAALQTVACGFTSGARFVLIKRTDSTGDWYVWDSTRGISSGTDPYLLLNSTAAEVTANNYVDTDSTGFKVTAAAPAALNASGGTYIFLAIA
jgi:hypothetical protein